MCQADRLPKALLKYTTKYSNPFYPAFNTSPGLRDKVTRIVASMLKLGLENATQDGHLKECTIPCVQQRARSEINLEVDNL